MSPAGKIFRMLSHIKTAMFSAVLRLSVSERFLLIDQFQRDSAIPGFILKIWHIDVLREIDEEKRKQEAFR